MPITIKLANPPREFHRAEAVTHLLAYKNAPFNERAFSTAFTNIVITETLSAHRRSTVYGGHLLDKKGRAWLEDGKQVDVVIKMGSIQAVTAEARRYYGMRHLQGSVLPRMYGLLKAAEGDKKRRMGLLVLERFGTSLGVPLDILERSEKCDIDLLLGQPLRILIPSPYLGPSSLLISKTFTTLATYISTWKLGMFSIETGNSVSLIWRTWTMRTILGVIISHASWTSTTYVPRL